MKKFTSPGLRHLVRSTGWAKLGLLGLFGLMANVGWAQPANDYFTNAVVLMGYYGTAAGSNVNASLDVYEPAAVATDDNGPVTVTNSVWYQWTALTTEPVEFDTIGSSFDTVLAVYTTTNGLHDPSLTLIAADDNSGGNNDTNNSYSSQLSFSAVAGTTYYISVNGNAFPATTNAGNLVLNWSSSAPTVSSGTFRFATDPSQPGLYVVSDQDSEGAMDPSVNPSVEGANITVTRVNGSSGRAFVDYKTVSATYTNIFETNYYGTNILTTYIGTNGVFSTNFTFTTVLSSNFFQYYFNGGYHYDPIASATTNSLSLIETYSSTNAATNFIASSGPLVPVPTNAPGPDFTGHTIGVTNIVTDSSTYTNIFITSFFELPTVFTNQVVASVAGFTLVTGTLVFDDYQMSQSFVVPVVPSQGLGGVADPGLPSLFSVVLSNPRLDTNESSDLEPPTLDLANDVAEVSVLSHSFPKGPTIFNFARSTYRVTRNEGNAVVTVLRVGGNACDAVSVSYRIDFPNYHTFPLQAGSDYATPGSDFTSVTGTLTWDVGDFNPKSISIPILNNGTVEFNEDMLLQLYNPITVSSCVNPTPPSYLGEVSTATLTILFDNDRITSGGVAPGQQPAGAVDRGWNVEGSSASDPPFLSYPGTSGGVSDGFNGNGGTVYAVAEQPNGEAIVAGSFNSFDGNVYDRIVRLQPNGYQDPSFLVSPNSGANDFITSLALQPNGQIIIGGNFTAFNGFNRHHIARLNADGSLDTTFNPGLGANDTVWALALQTNGQVIIAGQFTSVNGVNLNSVARLNADGSVDPTFNPGVGPDGVVNAVAVDSAGRVIIGGDFDAVSGVTCGGVARLNVDGSLDTGFAPGIGTYNPYTGVTDPVNALAVQTNGQILIGGAFSSLDLDSYNGIARLNTDGTVDTAFNPGNGTYNPVTGIADTVYAITLQPDGNILIGGDFTTFNQTRRVGLARLFTDGSVDTSFMDTAYNQFAGVPDHYHNPNAVNAALYPPGNQRNSVNAIALESGGNLIIGGNFLRVGGGFTRDDIRPRSNVARLIGNSTPGPGNIEFLYNSYSQDEDAGNLPVSLSRINGNLGIISATFFTNTAPPGPGIAGANDFYLNPSPAMPTWPTVWAAAWMRSVGYSGLDYVNIGISNDPSITENLHANFGLSNPTGTDLFFLGGENIPLGAALGSLSTAPLTIIDDNTTPGVLGFSSPAYSVVEGTGTATITITRTNGIGVAVSVVCAASNGTATNGVDYTAATNTVNFAANQTTTTTTFAIKAITTTAPDKTVNLRLFNPTGGAKLGLTNAVLTIINNHYAPGHLSFSSATYSTNENAGSALITVNRLGGSTGKMSVTVITGNGTATNGVNYIGSTNVLTWQNNVAGPTNIFIPVLDDYIVTSNLTVNLRLTNSIVNLVATNEPLSFGGTNATLTIVNVDSAGTVEFSSPVYSVKQYAGYALIPVVRTGGSVQTVSVGFATMDGTAINGVNYSSTNGILAFTNGQVSQVIMVPINGSSANNGPLFLNLVLSNAVPTNALGVPSTAVLNIIDTSSVDEPPGSPDVTYSSFAGMNAPVYAMTLQTNNQLLVGGDFTLADGVPRQHVARLNSDGTLDAGFLLPSSTYGANGSVRAIAVQSDGRILVGGLFTNFNSVVLDHFARLNFDGSLDSSFNAGSGADNSVYALAQAFVGGQSKILMGGSFATVDGTSFNGIARLNSDGTPDATFNVGLGANATVYALAVYPTNSPLAGKVIIGGDFTSVNGTNYNHIARLNTDGTLDTTFNPGTGAGDSVRAITIQLDGRILVGGLFANFNGNTNFNHIARLNPDGSVDPTFNSGLSANDAVFSIALQTDNRIVLGGEFTRCSGVTRNGITRLNPDGTVDPTINFGAGANNYVAAVVVQEDAIAGYPTNVPDEKIIIGGGFTQYDGQPHNYLARLYGGSISGSGAFEFSSANYQADENSGSVVITINRTGGTSGTNLDGSGDVFVPFTTSDDTATNGVNYIGIVTNVDFPEGEVTETIVVPLIDDFVITPNLTVDLALSSPTPAGEIGNQPTATITIINDDSAISFSSATYFIAKNTVDGVATINLVRQGSVNGTSTAIFETSANGTAVTNVDYLAVSNLVTFAPGVSNVSVTVPVINNNLPEGNGTTVTMLLANAVGSLLYSPTNATLTIINTVNVPGQLSFSASNYSVTEGGGAAYTNVVITVVRTLGSAGAVSAGYRTMDGTAVAGIKYLPTNGVVTFGDGETAPKTFTIQIRNTTTAEGPEYLNLLLTNATGGATLVAPTNAILTVLNTNTGIAFALATNTFSETGGTVFNGNFDTVFINVVRFNNTNATTTVNYATADGTATNGINYVGVTNTLTFNPGESVETIPVALIHDTNVTGTLTFTLNLSNPSSDAQLTPPSTTVIQELDAEAGLSFVSSNISVLKTAGDVILPVISSNPNIGPVSVNYSTGGGTATPGLDYTVTSGTLTFTNGQYVSYIVVPIVPNSLKESNQTFNVTLSSPVSPGVLVPPFVETVTIIETNTPSGLSFYSPVFTNGDWGSVSVDNNSPNAIFGAPMAWVAWTPTNSGEVEFDTIGSVDDGFGITNLSTYLSVFTGTNMAALNQVVVNAGLYPNLQYNYSGQNIFNLYATNALGLGGFGIGGPTTSPLAYSVSGYFYQPYAGPSQVRFNAVAGRTYYIAVETYMGLLSEAETGNGNSPFLLFNTIYSPPAGLIKINWALHPSGVFRFAQEDLDETGLTYSNGIPMLLYRVSETEEDRRPTGSYNGNQMSTTIDGTTARNGHWGYPFDVPGLLVSVTRVAGSSGRVQVGYTTEDIQPGSSLMGAYGTLINGDLPASSTYQFGTNGFVEEDYTPVSGVLTFDDSEMSKDIFIPIVDDYGIPQQNRDFLIVLTNAVLDPAESTDVQQPRLDNTFNQTLVRILDTDISPQGSSKTSVVLTNIDPITLMTNVTTNVVWNLQPTNTVFNFQKAHYRVTRDISDYWGGTPITVYVNRMGTNTAATTIYWRVNNFYLDNGGDDLVNGYFPLQPGSDYATPTPPNNTGILGLVPDFSFPSYSGTINFPTGNGAFNPQPITFAITNNGLQQFNEDFTISIYEKDKNGNPLPVGMVDQTTVTILYDDNHPPAGSVDEYYNADFSYNMAGPFTTVPPQMSHPGADGEVYGLAVQPDNRTIIVGDFSSYDQAVRNSIARINTDGSLDTSFNPGSGPDNYVNCIALNASNESFIGGDFSSYNGALRNGIALIAGNGSLDTSFNPGQGFNGTVYTLAFETNGEILAGGDFTSYNGVPRQYLALLNPDGSLDASFDPGTNLNAAVYAIGVQSSGQVIVGGDFTSAGGISGQDHITRLNGDGSFDPGFDPGSGANAAVFSLAIQPDGNIIAGGEFSMMNSQSAGNIARLTANGFLDPNFFSGVGADGPVYDLTAPTTVISQTNITVVTNSTTVVTNITIVPVQTNFTIYVGGSFTAFNGTHRLGFARLNTDGTVDTTFLDTAYNQFAGLPRDRYNNPLGTVLASGIQSDGNVMIGGSFERVGGGQSDEVDVRPESIDTNNVLIAESYVSQVQKTRTGIRNRSNIARLIGGATPGPGNVGLLNSSYSITKSQSPLYVSLVRTNGTLGPASANFAVLPGLAQNGVDYSYSGVDPLYWISWELGSPMGRMHSDGLFGINGLTQDVYGRTSGNGQTAVTVAILDNTNTLNNLSAQFQMADPIGTDQFYLGGEDTPLGVALGESVAPFTLIDDHQTSGTFGYAAASFFGTGPGAAISVIRTNGSYGVVSLNYATTTNGSTAILNSDYSAASGTLTFQPGDASHTFTVPILNNNSSSSIEKTVNLTLFGLNPPVNGIASWGLSNAVLRIINPNFQGYLSLSTNVYAASLSAGSVAITVNRTVGSKGTLNVQFATAGGTAVSGTDFVGVTTNLQWNNADVSPRTIMVPLINNDTIGAGRQFSVNLSNPALNGSSTPSLFATNSITNALVLINNDNGYGTFQFSSPGYVVNENGGYSTVTVIRTGGTNGTATVQYSTADGTAFAGTNYTRITNTLTFAPGQLAASFTVPILDDGKVDPPPNAFYFTVSLSNPSTGASLGSPATTTISIVDAESYNRPSGSLDTTFNPAAGMNGSVFALAMQSSGQILAGGAFTAVSGVPENYLARLNPNGSLDRSGFLYGLSGASGPVYALADQTDDQILVGGAFTNFNGTILNNIARLNTDGSLDSSFNPGAGADNTVYALAETFIGGSRKIYAAGSFGSMNGSAKPYIARLNNNGTVDNGFSTGAGPNAAVYAVAVYPTNSPFAGKVLVGGAFTNINNFIAGHVARLNADGSVDTSFDSNLNVGAGDIVRTIAIQSDGRVLIGGDFTNVNGVALNHIARLNPGGSVDTNFTAGVGVGANATVSAIAVQADNRIVVVGQFTQASGVTRNGITRLLPTGAVDPAINFGDGANGAVNAVVIQPADQMLVIGGTFTQYDDQPAGHIARIYGGSIFGSGSFTFTSAKYQVDENGIQALIGVRRVGGTSGINVDGSGSVSVNFATSDGTAQAGKNYGSVNVNVAFPAGEVLEFVPVPVMNDSNVETNLTVNLALSNPTPPAGLGDQTTAVLTIINDNSAVSFGSANYTVPKNILTGVGTIDVARIGLSSGSCSVDLITTSNGTAVPGVDFYPTNLTVNFSPGQTDVVVQVPIINNTNAGSSVTVIFALTNAVNTLLYSPTNATLTIINTVNSPGQLSFATNNYVVSEAVGNATITVQRTYGTSGSVSVNYYTVQGSALPNVNYRATSGSLTFVDGESVNTIQVPILNNSQVQNPVSFTVSLTNVTGGAALVSPTNTTVTILNTNFGVAFLNATNYIGETNSDAFIFVQRIGNTNSGFSVNYSTTNGTALAGTNYRAVNNTLNFAPGEVLEAIDVPMLNNHDVTNLMFGMTLSAPTAGAQLLYPSNAVVVVQPGYAGLSFTNSAVSVPKNGGPAIITVVCSNTNVEPVSVSYFTSDGTALAGQDYTAESGTLTFSNGIATNTFAVPVKNNTLLEGNRTFNVTLTNATGLGKIVSPSNQVVTITDNNSGLSFSSAAYTVLKTGVTATITVLRTDNINITTTVNFATADGTAAAGTNYVATSGTLVFTNGVTSQTFPVTIINNTVVQPDKTVLLQLSSPTNGVLVPPSAATLTIHDTSGSLVVPDGSVLIHEGGPTNGIIDPGENVTLLFAFRASAGTNIANFSATLLATNGVTSPSPIGTMTPGSLAVGGTPASQQFSFTASGTNGQQIAATFHLYNGDSGIGTAIFTYTLGTWTNKFYSTNAITINSDTTASPYPSVINVSGVGGVLIKATTTLTNITHASPADIEVLLVSPGAQDTFIMANAGGQNPLNKVTLKFDDAATNSLPPTAYPQTSITNGTYKPTAWLPVPNFP